MYNLVLFASGNGSNVENIIRYFLNNNMFNIKAVLTNNPYAAVIERVKIFNIPTLVFNKEEFYHSNKILHYLQKLDTNVIILAGFLWLVPEKIINFYNKKIINIHPALLPKYGGRGMYGNHVHKKVIEEKEKISGITIHLVNPRYDEGEILFQATCPVYSNDTISSLANRIHSLEYLYFPQIIESFCKSCC